MRSLHSLSACGIFCDIILMQSQSRELIPFSRHTSNNFLCFGVFSIFNLQSRLSYLLYLCSSQNQSKLMLPEALQSSPVQG